jgi:hypothetical protein
LSLANRINLEGNMNKLQLNRAVVGAACVVLALAGQPSLTASAQSSNIVIKPLSDTHEKLDALKTSVEVKLDGQNEKKEKIKGDMQVVFAYNTPKKMSLMEMKGPLLSMIMGSDLPMPEMIAFGVYSTGKDAYLMMEGKTASCTKMPASVVDSLANDNPTNVMGLSDITQNMEKMSKDKKLNGKKVGDEKVNGIATTRYTLDAATLKALIDAEKKNNPGVSDNKIAYSKGDLWVAKDGGYVVQFKFDGAGEMKQLEGFKGNVSSSFNLSEINNAKYEVKPPANCK